MFAKGYKIVEAKRFEIYMEDVRLNENEALVKVETAAICKADMRYYLGQRDERILGLKYPMNLLHEAIGTIVKDPTGKFKDGDKVVLVPNLILTDCNSTKCPLGLDICQRKELGENYCPKAKFASSNYNGFSREYLNYPVNNLVLIPKKIDNEVAVFLELISVACAAVRRVNIKDDYNIAVWGDGILGYILTAVLKVIHKGNIISVGKHKEKLDLFPSDNKFLINDKNLKNEKIHLAFECVGGMGSQSAINEIINVVSIGSNVVLTGVSEKKVEMDTRKILEKGLAIYGVTRSSVKDFKEAIRLFANNKFKKEISKLVISSNNINNIREYYKIFEIENCNKNLGKNILEFKF